MQFVYRNPHSFVHMDAPDASGVSQRWAVEWGGTGAARTGRREARPLKIGDKVVISGRPSRVPGEYRVLMVNLMRPSDGFTWGRGGRSRRMTVARSTLRGLRNIVLTCAAASSLLIRARRASVPAAAARAGAPPASPRQAAPIDLTGYWVSPIIEDWKYRMVTPTKGVFDAVPLNAEGRKIGETLGSGAGRSGRRAVPGLRRRRRSCACPGACASRGRTTPR